MLRDRLPLVALSTVGLGAGPATLAQFVSFFMGPGELEYVARSIATDPHSSTCATSMRRWLQMAGLADSRVLGSYADRLKHGQNAFTDIEAIGDELGAWVKAAPGLRPKRGDIVILNRYAVDAGHSAHMGVVDDISEDGSCVPLVEGGQVDEAFRQCIKRQLHKWTERDGKIFDTRPGSHEREVAGWIDVDGLEASSIATSSRPTCSSSDSLTNPSAGTDSFTHQGAAALELLDLSEANGPIVVEQIRDAGVAGLLLRATKGRVIQTSDIDRRLYDYANAARRIGLPFWLYGLLFARAGRPQDADQQARDLCAKARELGAERVVWMDVEREPGDEYVTEQENLDAIRMWLDGADDDGHEGGIYYGPGWWSLSRLRMKATDLAERKRWCSDFERSRPIGEPLAVGPWTGVPLLHQYAGGKPAEIPLERWTGRLGTVAGVSGYVDRSRCFGPLETLRG